MKTILAPTDFTKPSLNAVNYAADLAVELNARLILVNVIEVPMIASEIPVSESVFENMMSLATSDLEELGSVINQRTQGKITIEKRVTMGTVASEIQDIAGFYQPFAIVVGMHASNSIERFLGSSTTLNLIKHNTYPILVVPENVEYKGLRKVGFACDLVDVHDTIPHQLLNDWLTAFNPSLDIIHLSKNEHELSSTAAGESISLQNHFSRFNPGFHFLTGDSLSKGLNDYAKEQNLDLLVVIPKKHGFLSFFDKKHSKEIIENNQTAILAVHIP